MRREIVIRFGEVIVSGMLESEYVIVDVGEDGKKEGFFYAAGLIVRKGRPLACGGIGSYSPKDTFSQTGKLMTLEEILGACRNNPIFYSENGLRQIEKDSKKPPRRVNLE